MTRTTLSYFFCVLLLLGAIACGDDTGTADASPPDATTGDTGTADTGPPPCTMATAMDMTGMAAVTITDISAWSLPHSACISVSVGTTVTWQGNFTFHPLTGGVAPTSDTTSPVTAAGPGADIAPVDVAFTTAGEFPYFCTVHLAAMSGIVFVVP